MSTQSSSYDPTDSSELVSSDTVVLPVFRSWVDGLVACDAALPCLRLYQVIVHDVLTLPIGPVIHTLDPNRTVTSRATVSKLSGQSFQLPRIYSKEAPRNPHQRLRLVLPPRLPPLAKTGAPPLPPLHLHPGSQLRPSRLRLRRPLPLHHQVHLDVNPHRVSLRHRQETEEGARRQARPDGS